MSDDACRYFLLTPPGRGAVATIGVRGADVAACQARFFQPASKIPLESAPVNRVLFGRWRQQPGASGEELVICRTDVDQWEIHCHGGSAAVEAIRAALDAAGCQPIDHQQWLSRQTLDPTAQAALELLPFAGTERIAAMLLDQYRGAFSRAMQEITGQIDAGAVPEAKRRLTRLAELHAYAEHVRVPYRVVLAGAPNVGKSSLVNALVGYERSIVFDQPGTTRDVVTAVTALEGWLFEFSDTAGLRETGDRLESAGVARAARQLALADLIVWVRDTTRPSETLPLSAADRPGLLVWNKCDVALPPADASGLCVSAATGQGLMELQQAILGVLCPHPPQPGEAVPVRAEDVAWVQRLLDAQMNTLVR